MCAMLLPSGDIWTRGGELFVLHLNHSQLAYQVNHIVIAFDILHYHSSLRLPFDASSTSNRM